MLDEQTLETLSEIADELSIEVSKLLREQLQEHNSSRVGVRWSKGERLVFNTDDALDELVDTAIQGIIHKVYKGKIGVDI